MSWFNRIKEFEIKLPDITARIDGEFRLEVFKGFEFPRGSGHVFEYPGTRRVVADWFENIITDFGLDKYGISAQQTNWCQVGTDNTPEVATDTALGAFTAEVVNISTSYGAQASPPYYGHETKQYRFSPGFGGGNVNLNEVGIAGASGPASLTSRSLTKDSGGSPVTVTVLSDEFLDVFYKRRNYPAHLVEATGAPTDDTGSILVAGISYPWTIRPIVVTYGGNTASSTNLGWATGNHLVMGHSKGFNYHTSNEAIALSEAAVLGAVTSVPSGGSVALDSGQGNQAYVGSSLQRESFYIWGVSLANFSVGIGALVVKTTLGAYQIAFSTPIPKVLGQVFTYYHNFIWNRHTTFIP